jgi:hypothetical protein
VPPTYTVLLPAGPATTLYTGPWLSTGTKFGSMVPVPGWNAKMSSRVSFPVALQSPVDAGPGAQAWVNAPATMISPLTTAVLYTVERHPPLDVPNQVLSQLELPAKTLGVQLAAVADTSLGIETPALAVARPEAARHRAVAPTIRDPNMYLWRISISSGVGRRR